MKCFFFFHSVEKVFNLYLRKNVLTHILNTFKLLFAGTKTYMCISKYFSSGFLAFLLNMYVFLSVVKCFFSFHSVEKELFKYIQITFCWDQNLYMYMYIKVFQ